ncbi:MAG: primosomal protein N' [Acidobacteria bacterium]|nr:primosomal protein N' [Acidobacteriota bacterium]MBI3427829.1 primosomal protein N' [Acidobacteriota bacterium]
MFAEVAIPLNVIQTFTYALPASFAAKARAGARVLVPFGKQLLTAYIVDVHATLAEAGQEPDSYEVKEVEELFDTEPLVTGEMLELTKWIADYYYAPWGEVIKASLPAGINAEAETIVSITQIGRNALTTVFAKRATSVKAQALTRLADAGFLKSTELAKEFTKPRATAVIRELEKEGYVTVKRQVQQAIVKPKRQQAVRLLERAPIEGSKPLNEQQERIIKLLFDAGGSLSFAQLSEQAAVSPSVIRTLEKRGYTEVFIREVRRDPLAHMKTTRAADGSDDLSLTVKQQNALNQITDKLLTNEYAAFLLHGVTGSGKTEVYIRAMRAVVDRGKTALMLVPEIALTPMFARRLRAHFGEAVAILHSSLSDGERLDEWNRLRSGEARVCIGARSAIFAPLENIGLIVVDEEHEASYKQDESPRYHGRDTAIMRAAKANALIILGSATPSMESYHNAHTGKYTYLRLDERIGSRQLAKVEIVDMREVFAQYGKQQLFSDPMKSAIADNHARGEQTLVLLNRRGYSSFTLCRACGHTARCPNCDVTLTFHKAEARLTCHYCGHQERVPRQCPDCQGPYIYFAGEGTEQIETLLKDLYPDLHITRLDRDTTRRRGAFEKLLNEFASGAIDLMVGTQMIAKGHDFPNVTLVCVISVDAGLSMPDFRSAERTFQLLTQVAGRAGRGDKPGRVIIQSYHTEHYALEFAKEQNYEKFYAHEIGFRRELRYPPFVALINVLIRHTEFQKAETVAADLARLVQAADAENLLRVLGPAPAPLSRLKGEHRMQVLIKTRYRRQAREALDAAMLKLKEDGVDLKMITVEVDPVSLM